MRSNGSLYKEGQIVQHLSPEEIYEALQQTLTQAPPEAQTMYQHLPENWENLSDNDKAILQQASWKANLVIGEFTSDEEQK
jgi:hypothetical protein